MATPEPDLTAPKAFISYSWDDDAHKEWVKQLATRLRGDGVDVTLDRWHAAPGDRIPAFMERAVRENDFVIAVCTPRFKERSDGRGGGVGYEGDIMTTYAFTGGDKRKFIPVLRRGSWIEAAPTWLLGRAKIDLSGDPYPDSEYEELLRTLHGAREEAPPIGHRPNFGDKKGSQASPAPAPVTPLVGSSTPQHQSSVTPPQFDAGRGFQPRLNVRDFDYLLHLLEEKDSYPNGVLWPLVATRRAGKTWALKALENHLGQPRALYVNLPSQSLGYLIKQKKSCLLLDEPGTILHDDPQKLVEACSKLRDKGSKIVLAVSPAEWSRLWSVYSSRGNSINRDDLIYLEPLRDPEVEKLAIRRAAWAGELVPKLPECWTRHPFLLELVLELAEKRLSLRDNIPKLTRSAIDQANLVEHRYVERVFYEGFTDEQRDLVRSAARFRRLEMSMETVEVLVRCQILHREGKTFALADPILADHLPPPLRIHHVSDLHVGPKTADSVDVKAQGTHGQALGQGAGAKPVRDVYLDHVSALPPHRKPHVVVISGDLAEMGDVELYRETQVWLDRLESLLAQHDHPGLADQQAGHALPRILLVGGNHDVNWKEVIGPAGARKRHLPFAEAFEKYHRPRLEEPPGSRPLAQVSYGGELGVEFLLLGSAEFGGQKEEDAVWDRLVNLLNEVRQEAVAQIDQNQWDEVSKRLEHLSRIDPGLVHDEDLTRARKHEWKQPVRIAVLHHPVSPLPSTEVASYTGLINAGRVKNLLMEKRFCLVLHGHMHLGWFAAERWPGQHNDWTLHIAAAPTLGSRETQHELGYNVVEVAREGNRRFSVMVSRVSHDTGGGWPEKETMGPIELDFDGSRVTMKRPG